ncbi:MAG: hypothetical protein AAF386_12345, partial [Pseudomonadota bacterium]
MKTIVPAVTLALGLAPAAHADTNYSTLFADQGIAGTIATLSAQPTLTSSDKMALGGAYFLSALELTMQVRYDYGMSDPETAYGIGLPFLRLPMPENPNAKPVTADIVETVFDLALADLAKSADVLSGINDDDAVAVPINFADVWLDVDGDGQRSDLENAVPLFIHSFDLFAPADQDLSLAPTVMFDTSDAAWLLAYAHTLSGAVHILAASDPTDAIQRAMIDVAPMDDLRTSPLDSWMDESDVRSLDALAAFVLLLEGQPNPEHTRAAHAHWLNAIDANKDFWRRLDAETDDKLEFLPNERQVSATGLPFPAGVGTAWQSVLADIEDVLNGNQLLPHWR